VVRRYHHKSEIQKVLQNDEFSKLKNRSFRKVEITDSKITKRNSFASTSMVEEPLHFSQMSSNWVWFLTKAVSFKWLC
jgi:hypothetical protein